ELLDIEREDHPRALRRDTGKVRAVHHRAQLRRLAHLAGGEVHYVRDRIDYRADDASRDAQDNHDGGRIVRGIGHAELHAQVDHGNDGPAQVHDAFEVVG